MPPKSFYALKTINLRMIQWHNFLPGDLLLDAQGVAIKQWDLFQDALVVPHKEGVRSAAILYENDFVELNAAFNLYLMKHHQLGDPDVDS